MINYSLHSHWPQNFFFNSSQQLARFNELLDLFPPSGRNWLLKYLTVRFEFVCLNTNSSNVGNVVPPKLLFAQLTASWEKYQNSQLLYFELDSANLDVDSLDWQVNLSQLLLHQGHRY